MRRILTVNIMILLIFASASYWMEEGEKLKDTWRQLRLYRRKSQSRKRKRNI